MLLMSITAHSVHCQKNTVKQEGDVQLLVRPHVGDTLWLQLEQTIDSRSIPAVAERPEYGPVRERGVSQSVNMRMFAHSIIEASDARATLMVAITDSLNVRSGSVGALGASHPMVVAGR